MKISALIPIVYFLGCLLGFSQVIPAGAGDSKEATGAARPPQMNEGFIGRDVPAFDPGSEVMSYDGKLWNINNNRIFRARFEKFLNASAATSDSDRAYRQTIDRILDLIAPGTATKENFNEAFALLKKASDYKEDANLCRAISDAIYAAKLSLREIAKINFANDILARKQANLEYNIASSGTSPSTGTWIRQLSETNQTIANNKIRIAFLEMTTKGHLQALIMQFFATRRFEHVIITNRFYRTVYTDGDNSIDVFKKMINSLPANKDAGQAKINAGFDPQVSTSEGESGNSFSAKGIKMGMENLSVESMAGGVAAAAQSVSKFINSLTQIDALANEAIRDVNEGVEAYKFLMEQGELKSATERLQETFATGEYMPSVRLLSRDDKRRALEFTQKSNELLAALEVNDLTLAEILVKEIKGLAKDFDPSKPLAKIETAKSISSMHLAKARTAAISGDKSAMEKELRDAAQIWPRNPALEEVGTTISNQSDIQQQAMNDFDRLKSQKNYRQIYNDKMRFIAASALYPEKQKELTDVLQQMATVEGAIIKAREISQRGDPAGAWESVQVAQKEFPDDSELNQLRADLTTQASDFVQSLNQAGDLEKKGQPGSSLAWYLKARKKYPASQLAKEGIQRLSGQILPDSK